MTLRIQPVTVDLDDFLTLNLHERIAWLRSSDGPKGRLSLDKIAGELGTNRQTVIGWEHGREPSEKYAEKLAEFSGFPPAAFRRREAEMLTPREASVRADQELRSALERAASAVDRMGEVQAQILATQTSVVHRLGGIEGRQTSVVHRLEGIEGRLTDLEQRLNDKPRRSRSG